MSVAQGMTMVSERKNPSGCDENIANTSCDTSSSSDNASGVEENNCYDDGYIQQLTQSVPPLTPHVPPLTPPVPQIVDSDLVRYDILEILKKNTDALHLYLEKFHHTQANVAADHASGRSIWCTNNDRPATVGAVQSHGTNTMEIFHNLSSGPDLMYEFINDNNGNNNGNNNGVCATPEEDFVHNLNVVNMETFFQDDDELDIILPNDDDTLMFIEELKSTIQ